MDDNLLKLAAESFAAKHFIDDVLIVLNRPWPEARDRYKHSLIQFAKGTVTAMWVPDKTPLSQNSPEKCDTDSHISTGDNTSQESPVRENHSGDTSHKSGPLNEDNFAKPDSNVDNSQQREEAHKYKIGDLVRARDSICMVYRIEGDRYVLKNVVSGDIFGCLYDDELYPYVDPVELADLVEKRHRVLQFAAMAMQGILSNEAAITYATCNYRNSSCIPDRSYAVAHCALDHALNLIQAEKIRYEEYARIL